MISRDTVSNALNCMPGGGFLLVNLVNGPYGEILYACKFHHSNICLILLNFDREIEQINFAI